LPSLTLTNFLPSLWSSPPVFQPDPGNISAVALGETTPTGKEVWALVDTRVQKWNMSVEGWEEVVLDVDVAELLKIGVREVFETAPVEDSELDLELVDIAVERYVYSLFSGHLWMIDFLTHVMLWYKFRKSGYTRLVCGFRG
jgi:nuclear pore complex protein Nup133